MPGLPTCISCPAVRCPAIRRRSLMRRRKPGPRRNAPWNWMKAWPRRTRRWPEFCSESTATWRVRRREFRRALELNPGYATAHQWYALLLAEDDRDADAVRHAKEAVTLDPLAGAMRQTLGIVHYHSRRFEAAISEERRALELFPHLALARDILAPGAARHRKAQRCDRRGRAANLSREAPRR